MSRTVSHLAHDEPYRYTVPCDCPGKTGVAPVASKLQTPTLVTRSASPRRWLLGALAVAASCLGGCGVSPQPEPPSIDISLISLDAQGGTVTLTGSAGAVAHGASLTGLD